mmetsp:Transcript_760/g.1935  ORF Transcript_760/g.1935 Transcript_760/m.1935 type:complete len:175 (+) Transcript_760:207-731(+)
MESFADLAAQLASSFSALVKGYDPLVVMTTTMVLLAAVPMVLSFFVMRRQARKKEAATSKAGDEGEAEKAPTHFGNLTKEQLKAYTGKDPSKPLLVGIKGKIYDVTAAHEFYGPDGPYNLFTGIDASRALAKMSFKPEDLAGGIEGLSQSEKDILFDWEQKFQLKYKYVGDIVD